jgi:acyl-coenzyme A thioesterase PaaI-like protein
MTASEFDTLTHLEAPGDALMVGEIPPGWDIMGNVNGGALLAVAGSGLRRIAGRPDPITMTAHYLAPGRDGPVEVAGEVVKAGRQFAAVTGSLRQGGRDLLRVLGTFGDLGSMAGGYAHVTGRPPELPPMDECVPRTVAAPEIVFQERVGLMLDPACAGFWAGRRSGKAEVTGWITFADGRAIDTLALLLIADALPPTVFNIDAPAGWVPTIELTVHVRAIPVEGPVRCRVTTQFVHGGLFEEDGEYWDESGTLVAQSRQLALLPRSA